MDCVQNYCNPRGQGCRRLGMKKIFGEFQNGNSIILQTPFGHGGRWRSEDLEARSSSVRLLWECRASASARLGKVSHRVWLSFNAALPNQ